MSFRPIFLNVHPSGFEVSPRFMLTLLSVADNLGAFLALYSFFTSLGVFIASLVVYLSRSRTDKWQYLYEKIWVFTREATNWSF